MKREREKRMRRRDVRLVRREFGARRYRNTFVTYPGRFRPNICKITRPTAYPTVSLLGLILRPSPSRRRRGETALVIALPLIELHNKDDESSFTFATVTYDPCYEFRGRKWGLEDRVNMKSLVAETRVLQFSSRRVK